MMTVGFIGLGDMGGAMAQRIVDAGFPTVLWARRPEALAAYEGPNVEPAESPADLASRSDLVGVCVWADQDVRDVLEGDNGVFAGSKPGTVIAIHSTIAPATCRELAAVAAERSVIVLDVPVSGGRDIALAGSLAIAVGGDEQAAERCRPVFESFGDPVVYVGPVGAAQSVKLINNALLAANLALADDALTLGDAFGIRGDALAQMLRTGSGRSFGLDVAMGARTSSEVREQARPALAKDVDALAAFASSQGDANAALLLRASGEAVARLAKPPQGWVQ